MNVACRRNELQIIIGKLCRLPCFSFGDELCKTFVLLKFLIFKKIFQFVLHLFCLLASLYTNEKRKWLLISQVFFQYTECLILKHLDIGIGDAHLSGDLRQGFPLLKSQNDDNIYTLAINELRKAVVLCNQLLVCTVFNDLAAVEIDDTVGVLDRGKPVGNNDSRAFERINGLRDFFCVMLSSAPVASSSIGIFCAIALAIIMRCR